MKYRASLARRPASASTTGDVSNPSVETSLKLTTMLMPPTLTMRGASGFSIRDRSDSGSRRSVGRQILHDRQMHARPGVLAAPQDDVLGRRLTGAHAHVDLVVAP